MEDNVRFWKKFTYFLIAISFAMSTVYAIYCVTVATIDTNRKIQEVQLADNKTFKLIRQNLQKKYEKVNTRDNAAQYYKAERYVTITKCCAVYMTYNLVYLLGLIAINKQSKCLLYFFIVALITQSIVLCCVTFSVDYYAKLANLINMSIVVATSFFIYHTGKAAHE